MELGNVVFLGGFFAVLFLAGCSSPVQKTGTLFAENQTVVGSCTQSDEQDETVVELFNSLGQRMGACRTVRGPVPLQGMDTHRCVNARGQIDSSLELYTCRMD